MVEKRIFRKKRKGKLPLRFLLAVLIPAGLFFWMDANLRPVILTMAEAQARVMAVQAMNDAVFDVMRSGGLYDDLMTVVLDDNGRVSVDARRYGADERAGDDLRAARQQHLGEIAEAGISIPMGAALGSQLFAGSGPRITVKIVPVGAVSTEFMSEFSSAGINQTRHRIFLKLDTTVQMVIPTGTQTARVSAQVPVAESIIVGAVPDSFVDVANEEDMLNLLP